jgi:hypothetical protein
MPPKRSAHAYTSGADPAAKKPRRSRAAPCEPSQNSVLESWVAANPHPDEDGWIDDDDLPIPQMRGVLARNRQPASQLATLGFSFAASPVHAGNVPNLQHEHGAAPSEWSFAASPLPAPSAEGSSWGLHASPNALLAPAAVAGVLKPDGQFAVGLSR